MSFRLDSSIRNLLLDEFQDTSADQWKILRRLTQTLDRHDKHSFFCVGDGKQAIYGWRGGVAASSGCSPGSRLRCREPTGQKSSIIARRDGRREQIFQHVANHPNRKTTSRPRQMVGNHFPEHSTANDTCPAMCCFRSSPVMEGDTADERRGPWYRWVAEQIRELHLQTPGATIGVLTRTNNTVARIVHELSQLGPGQRRGRNAADDSAAVLALLSLLHLTSHPSCQVSRFHVASSPFGPVVGLHDWNDIAIATTVATSFVHRRLWMMVTGNLAVVSESVKALQCP